MSDMAFKSLARALIETVGGLDAAASASRVGRSQLAAYQSPHQPLFAPVDVVARLELLAGAPTMTAELARRAGYRLVLVEQMTGGQLGALLAKLGQEVGQVFAAYAAAWQDGQVTMAEKAAIQRELRALMSAASSADAYLTRALAERPAGSGDDA
ncbi:phage regulatory CII family protein [Roseomonas sp. F4]